LPEDNRQENSYRLTFEKGDELNPEEITDGIGRVGTGEAEYSYLLPR
jgi:hypothetical protein